MGSGFASLRTLRMYLELEVRVAAPVQSYCFTVETELIGPAMLNGAPPKHNDMQAVAFVPEMSHFHAQVGHIFVDQLNCKIHSRLSPHDDTRTMNADRTETSEISIPVNWRWEPSTGVCGSYYIYIA